MDASTTSVVVEQLRLEAAALRVRASRRISAGDPDGAAYLHGLALKLEVMADHHGSEDSSQRPRTAACGASCGGGVVADEV